MIFEIEISVQADSDLRNIYEYIAYELQSPENAIGQLDRLEDSILSLDQMPERFRAYEKEPWHNRGLRIMPVDNYCVFYIPNAEKAVVTIIRVMYGGRDIDTQLQKNTSLSI
ncbi:MAG: type II toxin-antitoxin system RelE/ParE family toxin [Lachnospiraceae bacterium]|nr:type II toxin-antitoxin system RelE/ParE family toxin [Lachnospiraceae bacterium]